MIRFHHESTYTVLMQRKIYLMFELVGCLTVAVEVQAPLYVVQ